LISLLLSLPATDKDPKEKRREEKPAHKKSSSSSLKGEIEGGIVKR
jgi:hypothetical protein